MCINQADGVLQHMKRVIKYLKMHYFSSSEEEQIFHHQANCDGISGTICNWLKSLFISLHARPCHQRCHCWSLSEFSGLVLVVIGWCWFGVGRSGGPAFRLKITCSFVCVRPSPKHLSLDSSFVYRQMSKITKEAVVVLVSKLCPTLCDPVDRRLPDPSVHGISQERRLEWVAIPFSRGSSWPMDRTHVSCIGRRVPLGHQGSPLVCSLYP